MIPDRDLQTINISSNLSYVWGYGPVVGSLERLYEMAKRDQWDGQTLAWGTDVDPEAEVVPDTYIGIYGSGVWDKLTAREVLRLRHEQASWLLSQFLHGEQGALLATAQLVSAVPSYDAKLYASTQVMDEARHVEVFRRYVDDKIEKRYAPNTHLHTLLDNILGDSRWDMKYLGMQIMVEGLALAAFGLLVHTANEPLLIDLLTRVMRDESRHVAFGVLSLRGHYAGMQEADIREREDFIYESARLMRDRFLADEVWLEMGLPLDRCKELVEQSEAMQMYRRLLFSKVVPCVKQLGLLSDRLRGRFSELGILEFEDYDPGLDLVDVATNDGETADQAA